jgi:hypothetical protein
VSENDHLHVWFAFPAEIQICETCNEIHVYIPVEKLGKKRKKKLVIAVKPEQDVEVDDKWLTIFASTVGVM